MVSRREALWRMGGLAAGAAAMGCTGETVPGDAAMATATAASGTTLIQPLVDCNI